MSDLLPALFLLAQAAAPPTVAPEPVEVEVQTTGSVDVPAQGYQLTGYYSSQQLPETRAPSSAEARKRALTAVDALGPVAGEVCSNNVTKFGFIGNEAVGGPAPEETEPAALVSAEPIQRTFVSLAAAQQAETLLRAAGFTLVGKPIGILFTCDAATLEAKADAVKVSYSRAQEYAGLLRLRVRGLKRLSDRPADPWSTLAGISSGQRLETPAGKVRVTATVTATYALER